MKTRRSISLNETEKSDLAVAKRRLKDPNRKTISLVRLKKELGISGGPACQ
ncbi:MAG: hypothetical protein NTV86_00655 [Planctomycetota bacterium]|nr:hypothetical protein [Planctomycetota bacterium]